MTDDPLYPKRVRLAKLMNAALDASFSQDMDPSVVQWKLNRRRDQRYSAESRELRCLPESHLDYLIDYYNPDVRKYVW